MTSFRPVAGNFFSIVKDSAVPTVSTSSPSGHQTTGSNMAVLDVTFTNGGSSAATVGPVTVGATGSYIACSMGTSTATQLTTLMNVYDDQSLSSSNLVATVLLPCTSAGTLTATQWVPAPGKTVQVPMHGVKTLYFTLPTSTTTVSTFIGAGTPTAASITAAGGAVANGAAAGLTAPALFAALSGSSTYSLSASITSYQWFDGQNTITASDNGYGLTLPLYGNTLQY